MDELQVIRACQAGLYSEFGKLYDAYHKKIYSFIYFRVHHRETAEDLTSSVFVKALENIEQFNPNKGTFSAWVYQIARNAIIDHVRKFKPTQDIETAWDLSDGTNIPKDFDAKEQLAKVQAYLKELDPHLRDIIIMRVWDGLSHKEIAEILGKSEASVKMAFSRALSKLNKDLAVAQALLLLLLIY